jgi:plastocyanin
MRTLGLRLAAGLSVATLTALSGCGGGGGGDDGGGSSNPPPTGPGPSANVVTVSNDAFSPANISVAKGATVRWSWESCTGGDIYGGGQTCVAHDIVFDGGATSGLRSSGTWSREFPTAGTFAYHCSVHGATMSGRVVVQ